MMDDKYIRWTYNKLDTVTGNEFLSAFFTPDDLESYIRERSYKRSDWDDPMDWINGMSLALAFQYREYFPDNNAEAKFRIQAAIFLSDLIRRIEWNEE